MTDAEFLKAVRERAAKATEGPWTVSYYSNHDLLPRIEQVLGHCEGCVGRLAPYHLEDASFIAHSREDIPRLLAMVEERDEKIRVAEYALDKIANPDFGYEHLYPAPRRARDTLAKIRGEK